MSAYLNSNPVSHQRLATAWPFTSAPAADVTIGLINNMPDSALESTERQFLSLLDAASGDTHIRLLLFSLPNIPHSGAAAIRMEDCYASTSDLSMANLDGLIVTGREPRTADLADEPYWKDFTKVLEWARGNTYSTIWSCLAAHAAVLHSDGILRAKAPQKYSGVFDCEQIGSHPLTASMPSRFKLPHSRWNGLSEHELRASGYRVLTRAADGSVDTFIKDCDSLFVYFQGHPEYESDTLLLEYRRDVGRYLRGESNTYPQLPEGYFDQETAAALIAVQQEAMLQPHPGIFPEVCTILADMKIENNWSAGSKRIYANWIKYLCSQKQVMGHTTITAFNDTSTSSLPKLIAVADNTHEPHIFTRNHKGTITQIKARRSAMVS